MLGFIYMWRDSERKMYYLGSHDGSPDDGYISSSRWFNGEYRYRPHAFKRRILRVLPIAELRLAEAALLKMIKDHEFGKKYYNIKTGREKGCRPWNMGKKLSSEHRVAVSKSLLGHPAWNKGLENSNAAENGRKSASKLKATVTGRKMGIVNGKRTWVYPQKEGRPEGPPS